MKIMSASIVLHVYQRTPRSNLARHVLTQATFCQRAFFSTVLLNLFQERPFAKTFWDCDMALHQQRQQHFNQPAMLCTCKRTAREQADWKVSLHMQTDYTPAARLFEFQCARANWLRTCNSTLAVCKLTAWTPVATRKLTENMQTDCCNISLRGQTVASSDYEVVLGLRHGIVTNDAMTF